MHIYFYVYGFCTFQLTFRAIYQFNCIFRAGNRVLDQLAILFLIIFLLTMTSASCASLGHSRTQNGACYRRHCELYKMGPAHANLRDSICNK
jgi:hypothetical protein